MTCVYCEPKSRMTICSFMFGKQRRILLRQLRFCERKILPAPAECDRVAHEAFSNQTSRADGLLADRTADHAGVDDHHDHHAVWLRLGQASAHPKAVVRGQP